MPADQFVVARKHKKLTQEKLVQKLKENGANISLSQIRRLEQGLDPKFSITQVLALFDQVGCEWLCAENPATDNSS
jgi:transcriptional regulator with XRE-family HTH domain